MKRKKNETRKKFCCEEFSILQKIHLIIFDTIEFNNKEKYRRKSIRSINFHESKLDEFLRLPTCISNIFSDSGRLFQGLSDVGGFCGDIIVT